MNILRERYNFHHRQQEIHETIEDFASALRQLASSCQFEDFEASILRDHLLFGLRDQNLTIKIVNCGGDPNIDDVVEICSMLDNVLVESVGDEFTVTHVKVEPQDEAQNVFQPFPDILELNFPTNMCEPSECVEIKVDPSLCDMPGTSYNWTEHTPPLRHSLAERALESTPHTSKRRATSKKGIRKRKEIQKWACPFCPHQVCRSLNFRRHLQKMHGELSETQIFRENMERTRGEKSTLACPVCQKSCGNLGNLKNHMRAKHPVDGTRQYECYICRKSCESLGTLRSHFNRHKQKQIFRCELCGYTTMTEQIFERHMQRRDHQNDDDNSRQKLDLSCTICLKVCTNAKSLREHVETRHEDQSMMKNYQELMSSIDEKLLSSCTICHKTFKNKYYVKLHIDNRHRARDESTDSRRYECFICHKDHFKTVQWLRSHIHQHARKRNHLCNLCGHMANSLINLKIHMMRDDHNLIVKPHQCDICEKRFSNAYTLSVHVSHHSEERNSICTVCGKAFKNNKNLGQHMRTHMEKQHQCPVCPFRCHTAGQLKKHTATHPTL